MKRLASELSRLRALDWRELDVREVGRWPLSLQSLCHMLMAASLFGVVYGTLVVPKAAELQRMESQAQELLTRYQGEASGMMDSALLEAQVSALESRLEQWLKRLPSDAEVPSLIDEISEAALEHRLVIDFIRLRDPTAHGFYAEQPFDIQVQGDYHRIAAFLVSVANLPRIVTLHAFTLATLEEPGPLRLTILAKTYHYRVAESL